MNIGDCVEVKYTNSDGYLQIYKGIITGITKNGRYKVLGKSGAFHGRTTVHSYWSVYAIN